MAVVLVALTATLLLSGSVSAAIWMEGPYFPLTRLLPEHADTLSTMVAVVAIYYFVAVLVARRVSSRRAILVVLVVIALNTLGLCVWQRQGHGSSRADVRPTQAQEAAKGAARDR